ncbi:DUF2802 domain-containing protein [Accumulibacter sp.]|uniref:DUF2802 domain-containing protein n=1 Tax=Accumulibacter sp. TaxID=2053492 RepID=UPI0028C40543|nr:DUF2802 domain-containing protein [Accumulibacter sp.]
MDLELLGNLGWREGLIAVIVALLAYIVVMFVRMRRMHNDLHVAAVPPSVAQSALAVYTDIENADSAVATESARAGDSETLVAAADSPSPLDAGERDFAWNEPPPEIPGQAMIEALQGDVRQLRSDLDALVGDVGDLRRELLTARDDFRRQLTQLSGSPPAASPLYNDAMQMAIQGQDASTIAQRCGIARAEADLVVALVRNRNEDLR